MPLLIDIVDRGARTLLAAAPAAFRREWADDAAATLRACCVDTYEHAGRAAVLRMGIAEWASMARLVVRQRLGRALRLSPAPGGSGRRSPQPPRASTIALIGRDLATAWRTLASSRLNATIAFVTLALGIGVTAAVFSVVDAVLWRPVPFANADRLSELANYNAERKFLYAGMPRALVSEWRTQTDLFDRVEAYEQASVVYRDASGATMVPAAIVTPGLLPMLGRSVALGRDFTDADGRGGTDRIAIVSEAFWRSRLQQRNPPIGVRLSLDGADYDVVGVMPRSFRFPDALTEIWLPYNIDAPPPDASGQTPRSAGALFRPYVRVRPGLSLADATPRIQARGGGLSAKVGNPASVTATTITWGLVDDKTSRTLSVLAGAVGFLLVIVCANVANLSLSRSLGRLRDLAVRAALGASRAALVRQTLVENLLLGAAGALGGVGVAGGLIAFAGRVLPDSVRLSSYTAIDLDGRTLVVIAALGAFTAILFGLPPALMASHTSAMDILRQDSRAMTGSRGSRRVRGALVIAEVAVSLVLLVGAALMTRTLIALNRADRGLDPKGLVAVRLGLPRAGYADPSAREAFVADAVARARQLPGVVAAAAGVVPPEFAKVAFGPISIDGAATQDPAQAVVPVYDIGPDYFQTLRLPVLSGRPFGPDDRKGVAMINDSFARKYWPDRPAVGGQFRVADGPWVRVVGVVADVRRLEPGASKLQPQIYEPPNGGLSAAMPVGPASAIAEYRTIVVRVDDAVRLAATLPPAIHTIDPTVVVWKIDAVEHLFADAIARPRVLFVVMLVFAGFSVLLAAAGLYGALASLVGQRQREIGIRLALGARPARVGLMVVRSGLLLTGTGLIIGLVAALMLVRVMRTLLYQVEPSDPISVAAVVVVLIAASALACWRPARQAMRVDPLALLKAE